MSTNENESLLTKVVRESANPNPTTLVVIILTILIVIAVIYVNMYKLTGQWLGSDGVVYNIDQDGKKVKFTTNMNTTYFTLIDNMLVGQPIGVWDYKSRIWFMNGFTLRRLPK